MKKIMLAGTSILAQKDDDTPDGLRKTFATNVFGHFLMVQFLMLIFVSYSPIVSGETIGEKIIQSESTMSCNLVIFTNIFLQ